MGFLASFDGDKVLTSKAQSNLRWPVLFFVCLLMIGSYFTYDEPAALKNQIDDYMGDPSDYETMFSLLYSVYSFPNIILPFFGGYLVDRFNARNCQLFYAFLIVLGNLIFAIGMNSKLWSVMYVGRAIHGMGGISICVATSATMAQWFSGKELAFAFGFNLSFCRLGSVINNMVSPQIAASRGVPSALWFGFILCIVSFFCAVAIIPMEIYVEDRIAKTLLARGGMDLDVAGDESQGLLDNAYNNGGSSGDMSKGGNVGADVDKGEDGRPLMTCVAASNEASSKAKTEAESDGTGSKWDMVKSLSPLFWLLCLMCVSVYGCVFPFNNIESTLLLERNYFMEQPNSACALTYDSPGACQNSTNVPNEYCNNGQWYQPPVAQGAEVNCVDDNDGCFSTYCDAQSHSEIQAAAIMSIPYIIVAVFCPIFGALVDLYGQRATLLAVSPALLVVVHLCIGLTDISIVLLLIGQGSAYCLFAAVLWPSISLVLQPENFGLGYGFVFAIQNCGNAAFPLVIAQVYMSSGEQYIPNVEMVFVGLSSLATCIGVSLCYYDYTHNGVFNSPSGKPISLDDSGYDDGYDDDKNVNQGAPGSISKSIDITAEGRPGRQNSKLRHRVASRDSRDGVNTYASRSLSTSSVNSVSLT